MKQEIMQITESNKYNTKDIAKWIRQTLKATYKDLKFSVVCEFYSCGSSISLTLLENNMLRIIKKPEEITEQEILRLMTARNDTEEEIKEMIKQRQNSIGFQVNQYHIDSDWQFTEKGKQLLKEILAIANKYNYDHSDSMIDYFDVNYYLNFNLGKYDKPYKEVEE